MLFDQKRIEALQKETEGSLTGDHTEVLEEIVNYLHLNKLLNTKLNVSGVGNFGNPFSYENVKKSVIINDFKATSFELTNKKRVEHILKNLSYFTIDQSWGHFLKLAGQMTIDNFKRKDF